MTAGEVVLRMENPALTEQQRELEALRREVDARRNRAWEEMPALVAPIDERLRSIDAQLRELALQIDALAVRAPHAGLWSAPHAELRLGAWVPRGALLGRLRDPAEREFEAVVRLREVDRLLAGPPPTGSVRLHGAAGVALTTGPCDVQMAESHRLPFAALGWRGGGDIAVDADDADGLRAQHPFFTVRAPLEDGAALPPLFLRTGVIRLALPAEPWGRQIWRALAQFVQEHYGR